MCARRPNGNASRIKWAEHLPLSDILDDQLPDGKRTKSWCCNAAADTVPISRQVFMKQAGYLHAKSLAGGVFAWSNAGFPVVLN
jgi:hydroxyacylglutathione hydrolase